MLNDPSVAEQEKKKLCIVCSGPDVGACEVLILDLESDLKDKVQVDVVEQVDESADLVALTPIARLDSDLVGIRTFCVSGSKLYVFDDGYSGFYASGSIKINDDLKSAYAYDFSASSSSSPGVVKLNYDSAHKIKDMWGPKALPRAAAPTPDGKYFVVFSTEIQYDPCDDDNQIERIDFELYDSDLGEWFKLPELAKLVAEKGGRLESNYYFSIQAFFFVTNSTMLVLIKGYGYWFSLELDFDKHKGVWLDVDRGAGVYFANLSGFPVPQDERRCIVFGRRICVSSLFVFDTLTGKIFYLPYFKFAKSSVFFASTHVTLLSGGGVSPGGELCKFARVYMGTCTKTSLPHIVVDVFTFNLDTYIKRAADECLEIQLVKTSEFILGNKERSYFWGYDVFPIIAGINVSSTHEPPRILSLFRGPFVPFRPDPVVKGLRILL